MGYLAPKILDCIGIGFGPANIALAVAMRERGFAGQVLFLEKEAGPSWQPGMLLPGTDIQHNPLRDFITPSNPRSRYGFLSYLEAVGRLFEFLNLDQPYPPRLEYAGYVRWVADQFADQVCYGESVSSISLTCTDGGGLYKVQSRSEGCWFARSLVFAPGRNPLLMPQLKPLLGKAAFHASEYLFALTKLEEAGAPLRRFAVIGASQSAVEITLDLLTRYPNANIDLIFRGQGIKLKDTSPFTERIYFPSFVDYFHQAADADQLRMSSELWRSNYGAADHDIIAALYLRLYEQKVMGKDRIRVHAFQDVISAAHDGDAAILALGERNTGEVSEVRVDAVFAATGYRNFGVGPERELFHPLLTELAPMLKRRGDGSLHVARNFGLSSADADCGIPPIFLNGLCEATHGFGDAGSFSLLAVRSATVLNGIEQGLSSFYPKHATPTR